MTGNPETFRPTDLERKMLEYLVSVGYSKSDVIRDGIRKVYEEVVRIPVAGKIQDGKVEFHPDWAAENDK